MKREKYRYDEWPAEGIAGRSGDKALELAIAGELNAYAYLRGDLEIEWQIHVTGERISEDGPIKDAILLHERDVEVAAYSGEALIQGFRAYRSIIESAPPLTGTGVTSRNFSYKIASPYPKIKKEDIIFFVADMNALAAQTSNKPTNSEAAILEWCRNNRASDISTIDMLRQAECEYGLYQGAEARLSVSGKPKKGDIYQAVVDELNEPIGLDLGRSAKTFGLDAVRKRILAIQAAHKAIESN